MVDNPLPTVAYRIASPKNQHWLSLASDGSDTYIRCNDGRWYRRDAEGMSSGHPIALWIVGGD